MKKIIALCSVLVALAVVVTMFTACGDKTEDETTTTTTTESNVEIGGVTIEVGTDAAVIKEDGFVVQTLKYPKDSDVKFDLEYAKEHYEFIDLNFDGVEDFYIAVSSEKGIINYYCWLYNETSKLYEYSKDLSALKNISVDADQHLIVSKLVDGNSEKISCYKWVDGVLTLDKTYDSAKDEIPEDVTNAVTNNSIGVNKNPETTNKAETTKKNSSDSKETTKKQSNTNETTKKPLITTTTQAQQQDGVVLNTNADIDDGWF